MFDFIKRVLDIFSRKVNPSPVTPPDAGDFRAILLSQHNSTRSFYTIQPLASNKLLEKAAQKHADWMAIHNSLQHENDSSPGERIKKEGYLWVTFGENIAYGTGDAAQAFSLWMNSPGHRSNILASRFHEVGFGYNNKFWCVVFGSQNSIDRN